MDDADKITERERRIALDARDWIVRLTSGHVSDATLERFKTWRDVSPEHKRAFERERAFWQELQVLDGNSSELPSHARPPSAARSHLGRRGFLAGSGIAAAAALTAVSVPRLQQWWSADFSTAIGEQAEISLPDGSVATLNTDSAIAFDFTPQLRLVTLLKGEAGFDVRPSTAGFFRVAALGGNSDTRDATFLVKSTAESVNVSVERGHARVAGQVAAAALYDTIPNEISLLAGQQTSYLAGRLPAAASSVDIEIAAAWRSGKVIFEGKPFSAALTELGRYLPERIVLRPGSASDVPVSAIFSTRNAYEAVQALAKTQGLVARRIPGVMIVLT